MRTLSRALLALLCFGCESVIGADFDVKEVVCTSAQPPERPTIRGENPEFPDVIFGALTKVDFGDRILADGTPAYRTTGFDLDRVCALQGARPSCTPFGWANPNIANGLDGRDNQAGALILDQIAVFNLRAFTSDLVSKGIKEGKRSPGALVRVTKYNRRSDDDQVEVDWYIPLAYQVGHPQPPTLTDADTWPVWKGSIDDPDALKTPPTGAYPASKFRDPNAYVRNFEVVARMPKGTPFQLASVPFSVDDLVVVLKLAGGTASDPKFYVERATVAGHVSAKELFQKMPRMTQLFFESRICSNDGAYQKVKRYFCAHVDSLTDGRNAPDTPCDALSVGVSFEATPARMGAAFDEPPFEACPPASDPANDTCAIPATE